MSDNEDEGLSPRSGDDMESFDEDSDSESDIEDVKRSRSKKRKRNQRKRNRGGNEYILDEAEVDDDVEDDEEYEDGFEDIIDSQKRSEESHARELDSHRRLKKMFDDQKEDEIEEYYRNKYAEASASESR